MKDVCAPALLANSGPATPSIAPRPKRRGVWRHLLLDRVGSKRAQHRAVSRQDAERAANGGAADDRPYGLFQLRQSGKKPADLRARHRGTSSDRGSAEFPPIPNIPMPSTATSSPSSSSAAPNVMRKCAVTEVGPDRGKEDAEDDREDRIEHRPASERRGEDEADDHQGKILGRAEGKRHRRQRKRQAGDKDVETVPAKNEPKPPCRARCRHGLALPFRARRAPSRSSCVPRGSRENRRRRAAILRPVIDARDHDEGAAGSKPKVNGRRIAMVAIGPIPGRTPIRVPSMQPTKQRKILIGTGTQRPADAQGIHATFQTVWEAEREILCTGPSSREPRSVADEPRCDRDRQPQHEAEQANAQPRQRDGEHDDLQRPRFRVGARSEPDRQRPGHDQSQGRDSQRHRCRTPGWSIRT